MLRPWGVMQQVRTLERGGPRGPRVLQPALPPSGLPWILPRLLRPARHSQAGLLQQLPPGWGPRSALRHHSHVSGLPCRQQLR